MIPILSVSLLLTVTGIILLSEKTFRSRKKKRRRSGEGSLKSRMERAEGIQFSGLLKKIQAKTSEERSVPGCGTAFLRARIASAVLAVPCAFYCLNRGNWFLLLPLGAALWLLPHARIRGVASRFRKRQSEELESALSLLTASYQRTESLLRSVRETLPFFGETVSEPFATFLTECESIDAAVPSALSRLQTRIPDPLFSEWIQTLQQCQNDRTMIPCLSDPLGKFGALRRAQAQLEANLASAKTTIWIMAGITAAILPAFRLLNPDWYAVLSFTFPGHLAVAAAATLLILTLWRVSILSAPVRYDKEA
ncbi:MAG: hypothetical protein II719_06930 [Clostridia bacterium]|nr:hypothetical protein [Clostridia bacterium]